ncbi:MAG: hypothetical protein WCJ71_04905 [Candidatus Omnitrophota bacterium]
MDNNPKSASAAAPEKEEVLFKWDYQIKMLFNPVLWGNFVVCFGIPAILLGIGFSFTGQVKGAAFLAAGLIVFFAVIWFITGIVIDIGGGFAASFVITSRGIYFTSGPGSKKAADIATVIGLLAGSASGTGAGLLARAEQDNAVAWEKIKKVKVRKGMRYIFVRGGFGNKPIGLYCNKENFDQILALVQSKFKR